MASTLSLHSQLRLCDNNSGTISSERAPLRRWQPKQCSPNGRDRNGICKIYVVSINPRSSEAVKKKLDILWFRYSSSVIFTNDDARIYLIHCSHLTANPYRCNSKSRKYRSPERRNGYLSFARRIKRKEEKKTRTMPLFLSLQRTLSLW